MVKTKSRTRKQLKYMGGKKALPLTQYGGSPQDDFFDAIQQLLDGNLLTNLEKLIGVFIAKPPIDINARNNKGETALTMLVKGIPRLRIPLKKCAKIAQIRVKLVKLLLENGALIGAGALLRHNELFRISKRYGSKPPRCIENDLDSARWNKEIEHARLKMADLLLMHGSVNQPRSGDTPLNYAVWCLDVPYVKLLLERGANVQAKDSKGETPLMLVRSMNVDSWLLPNDPMSTLDGRQLVQSTIYQIESILLKHYAKRNTKQRLVDQMGPPNMKDLQETAELPRGSRIEAEPDDYPFFYEKSSYPLRDDGDGILRKNIKSYLGGKKTRRLRTKLRGGTKSKGRKALKKRLLGTSAYRRRARQTPVSTINFEGLGSAWAQGARDRRNEEVLREAEQLSRSFAMEAAQAPPRPFSGISSSDDDSSVPESPPPPPSPFQDPFQDDDDNDNNNDDDDIISIIQQQQRNCEDELADCKEELKASENIIDKLHNQLRECKDANEKISNDYLNSLEHLQLLPPYNQIPAPTQAHAPPPAPAPAPSPAPAAGVLDNILGSMRNSN